MILNIEEATWRLKSRATWVKCGDNNSIFFHNFANERRVTNSIWDLEKDQGHVINTHKDLSNDVVHYFKKIFSDGGQLMFEAQLKVLQHFPSFFPLKIMQIWAKK